MTCDLCTRKSHELDFSRIGCRVRFLLSIPKRQIRAEWLDRWREKDGSAMVKEIEAQVIAKWVSRI